MKVLIIEDEMVAAKQLRRLLEEADSSAQILAVLQSIEESVEYFRQNPPPDLVFMDIHLADGSAFRIFDQVKVVAPVVFTTAYDQYALQAFQVNSIDYLLKPINLDDLRRAMSKYGRLVAQQPAPKETDFARLMEMMRQHERQYKSYFLLPVADKLVPVAVKDIAYIYLDNKVANIVTFDGCTHAVDKPLDSLVEQLDPQQFYRANRQVVVAHKAISDISFWLLGKLKLGLCVPTPENIIIPKAKVPEFKEWYSK